MVQNRIAEAGDGIVLFARLYTDALIDRLTAGAVEEFLAKLPNDEATLDVFYEGTLEWILWVSVDRNLARQVLCWITFARRPLTTAELYCALAVEHGKSELNPDYMYDDERLLSACAGLIVIDEETTFVHFVYKTAQEYFERTANVWNLGSQQYIVTTCTTYLCSEAFQSGPCSTDREFEERLD
ncbi:hypothetical protein GQ44DRAFT_773664 [Phaeosphaeriaceae sp. PMI808]|nr:hypothetical protein GQ44DRAFT_773664 [Phaeosphaeriaceae sp. PMI808]